MDTLTVVLIIWQSLWWLIPLAVVIAVIKSSWFKGLAGEVAVNLQARLRLPKSRYHRFHNVTLPTPDGTTQIDHVFVSRFGIFVVETKNMKGWIFGDARQAQWTQKLYRKSYRFQNPLRQNYKHVKALESALQVPAELIHSVVVFTGDCKLKTAMPANVIRGGKYIRYIKSFREPVLGGAEMQELTEKIRRDRLEPTQNTHREHVHRLRSRNDPSSPKKCPKCGNDMVLRKAAKGQHVGTQFWGCSAFPKCKTTLKVNL